MFPSTLLHFPNAGVPCGEAMTSVPSDRNTRRSPCATCSDSATIQTRLMNVAVAGCGFSSAAFREVSRLVQAEIVVVERIKRRTRGFIGAPPGVHDDASQE